MVARSCRGQQPGAKSPGKKDGRAMYPGFFGWWKRGSWGPHHEAHAHGGHGGHAHGGHAHGGHGHGGHCGSRGGNGGHDGRHCGHHGFGRHGGGGPFGHAGPGDWEGSESGGFGVRRPLRFLAWKLELEEDQVAKLAAILDELKTERAQAAVDQRRTVAALADVIAADVFDEAKATEAGDARVKSAERLRTAVVRALGLLHGILDPEQRNKLSYLLRTGALTI